MAQIITTKTENKPSQYGRYTKVQTDSRPPLFRTTNYILMGIGAVILFIGYIALSGGGSTDPTQFSEAIFDNRRLVFAPIMIILGLVVEIVAIMYHPRSKKVTDTTTDTKTA